MLHPRQSLANKLNVSRSPYLSSIRTWGRDAGAVGLSGRRFRNSRVCKDKDIRPQKPYRVGSFGRTAAVSYGSVANPVSDTVTPGLGPTRRAINDGMTRSAGVGQGTAPPHRNRGTRPDTKWSRGLACTVRLLAWSWPKMPGGIRQPPTEG
jgi:hypothetical protein